jgi:hypothetical protein
MAIFLPRKYQNRGRNVFARKQQLARSDINLALRLDLHFFSLSYPSRRIPGGGRLLSRCSSRDE